MYPVASKIAGRDDEIEDCCYYDYDYDYDYDYFLKPKNGYI